MQLRSQGLSRTLISIAPPPPDAYLDQKCTVCKKQKSILAFVRDRSRMRGVSSTCRDCHRTYQHTRYLTRRPPSKVWPPRQCAWQQCNRIFQPHHWLQSHCCRQHQRRAANYRRWRPWVARGPAVSGPGRTTNYCLRCGGEFTTRREREFCPGCRPGVRARANERPRSTQRRVISDAEIEHLRQMARGR